MVQADEIITPQMVELLLSWRHPGFSVYRGDPVQPDDTAARERLARYILHAPFAQERMIYDRSAGTVASEAKKKNGDPENTSCAVTVSPALDWLAALVTHIPDKRQQLVRFYGRYSNVGQRLKKRTAAAAVQNDDKQAPGENDSFGSSAGAIGRASSRKSTKSIRSSVPSVTVC